MSYRDESQSLEKPIDKILEGIEEFREAVKERMKGNDWQESHLGEIDRLSRELTFHERQLMKIKKDTW